MVRIGLLSDTHGYIDPLVKKYFSECDEIWHAGDIGTVEAAEQLAAFKPLKGVYGNIDGQPLRSMFPLDLKMKIEGVKIYMTHIGGYPGRYSPHSREQLFKAAPDLFICGHSHILKVIKDQKFNMMTMNPGAAGNIGFHKIKTMLRFTIDNGKLKDLEAIEMGSRSKLATK